MHSPARHRHNVAAGNTYHLIKAHAIRQYLGIVFIEKALVTLTRNDYEPDVAFFSKAKAHGINLDLMRYPAPDLAVEVLSPSTESNDRGVKFEDYAGHGVAEYWIVDPDAETVDQYLLAGSAYRLSVKLKEGEIESPTLSGFRIPVRAIFDEAENHRALARLME